MDELFSLRLNRDMRWEMADYHLHNYCEVLFIVAGECECLLGADLIELRRGTVLALAADSLHKTNQSSGGEYARYALHFPRDAVAPFSTADTDLLKCFLGGGELLQLSEQATWGMTELFEGCRAAGSGYGADIRRRNAFFELLVRLGELSSREGAPRKVDSKSSQRLRPILTYIAENLTEPLSLDHLAQKFHFNKQYLCRLFKQTTGVSVGAYIASTRVQHACRLLRGGASVQRSGEESGFTNNSAFITSFGRIVGVSPGRYKKSLL